MISQLENHLWQSTVFACVVALMTLILRRNRAALRYGLWLTASVKFLIPFGMLIAIGRQVEWKNPALAAQPRMAIVKKISEPFAESASPALVKPVPNSPSPLPEILLGVWICGFAAHSMAWWRRWRRVREVLRAASPLSLNLPIPVMSSPAQFEPGIFGLRNAVLLLPQGITRRLTPAQFEAVIAHELCHVRRRDNLTAATHMVVEALFWFHPLVWWIERRLVEERERACDEEVLKMASDPQDYADAIVNVCRFCLESPLFSVSGITGADLKRRIEAIMTNPIGVRLNFAKKAILAVAAATAIVTPVVVGIVNAPKVRAQSPQAVARSSALAPPHFEVASIRLNRNPEPGGNIEITPGRFRGKDLALQWLILTAYRLKSGNLSGNLPDWTISERYDIDARTEDGGGEDRVLPALQILLKDRFQLREHREMKEEPVYFLTAGKSGIKMPPGSCVSIKKDFPNECWSQGGDGLARTLDWRGTRLSDPGGVAYRTLAGQLSLILRRTVIDKTGLTGTFDVHLHWAADVPMPSAAGAAGNSAPPALLPEPGAPSIFDALEKQLGLKLESGRGPVEYLIVDHVERPSEN